MKIGSISLQNFQGRKSRLPVKTVEWVHPDFSPTEKINWVKEFSNPNAEVLYKKAKKTSNLQEKMKLLEQMGKYRLFDIEKEIMFENFIEKLTQKEI